MNQTNKSTNTIPSPNLTITYYVQRYRPTYEAISKEVQLLATHFAQQPHYTTHIYDLHLDGLRNIQKNQQITSHHFALYPLLFPLAYNQSKKSKINHIYTSLGDLPYLTLLPKSNTLLTAAASCNLKKIKTRLTQLKKIKKIIVETNHQKQQLLSLNIPEQHIELIYPPVNLNSFTYQSPPKHQPFTILYASCPTRTTDFEKRGINLLMETAKQLPHIQFLLAWRSSNEVYHHMQSLLQKNHITNIILHNEILTDMNALYAKVHCTIIPYTIQDDFLKMIPNSAIESLAAGKPVLTSTKTEIASLISSPKKPSGLSFDPSPQHLSYAIALLQKKYPALQKNCQPTAQSLFSQEIFLKKYEKIYSKCVK